MAEDLTFVLEIYCEEIPHQEIPGGVKSLKDIFIKFFKAGQIKYKKIETFSTPRRIGLSFEGLPRLKPSQTILMEGPPIKISFFDNSPTKVYQGWARKVGAPLLKRSAIKRSSDEKKTGVYSLPVKNKGDILIYKKINPSLLVIDMLKKNLPSLISLISFSKSMYWGRQEGPFVRPVHSFLAMLGKEVISFEKWGIKSSNFTYGHSQLKKEKIFLSQASEYKEKLLKEGRVWVQAEERKNYIEEELDKIVERKKLEIVEKNKVTRIVNNLVEFPYLLLGGFNPEFLKLPDELIINELVEHQKYFPVKKKNHNNPGRKELVNQFIITSNIPPYPEVKLGNERVLRARLNDGKFLYENDLKVGLDAMVKRLAKVIFQEKLGTYKNKYERMETLAHSLNEKLSYKLAKEKISLAAKLAKADLTSGLVAEFPQLQGVIGFYYAKVEERDRDLALSLKEHYLPISQNDPLPTTQLGILIALADKLDNIFSLFAVGFAPTSSQDRYALKRQGYGIIKILIERGEFFDLVSFVQEKKYLYTSFLPNLEAVKKWELEVKNFFEARTKSYLSESEIKEQYKEQHLKAIQISPTINPHLLKIRLMDLDKFIHHPDYEEITNLFKRIDNILEKNQSKVALVEESYTLKEKLLEESEKNLWQTKVKLDGLFHLEPNSSALSISFYEKLISLIQYKTPLNDFFNKVMINHTDKNLRNNRYYLLISIRKQIKKVINFNFLYNKN